jgi:hypothetical protein
MTQANTPGGWCDYQPGPDAAQELTAFLEGVIDGTIEAVQLPWPCLSRLTQMLMPQTVTVLCGEGGASKSLTVLQLLYGFHHRGVPVAYFALEGKRREVIGRLLAQLDGEAKLANLEWCKANPARVRSALARHGPALASFGERVTVAPNAVNYDAVLAWMREQLARGARVVCVDPITMASPEREPWAADQWFIGEAKRLLEPTGASLIVVTHPKKGGALVPGMDGIAGGAAWARFSDSVLWLRRMSKTDEPVSVCVASPLGGVQSVESNREMQIHKARNGRGAGLMLAFAFSPQTFLMTELGIVRKGEGED